MIARCRLSDRLEAPPRRLVRREVLRERPLRVLVVPERQGPIGVEREDEVGGDPEPLPDEDVPEVAAGLPNGSEAERTITVLSLWRR